MFTVLSCDWGRIYTYATFPTMIIFLLFPIEKFRFLRTLGKKFRIYKFNRLLSYILTPTKQIMIILLLSIGVIPWGTEIAFGCRESPLGSIIFLFNDFFILLYNNCLN